MESKTIKRVTLRLPADIVRYLEETARSETDANGGAVRRGGAGIVTPGQVIERLVKEQVKRDTAKAISQNRKAGAPCGHSSGS